MQNDDILALVAPRRHFDDFGPGNEFVGPRAPANSRMSDPQLNAAVKELLQRGDPAQTEEYDAEPADDECHTRGKAADRPQSYEDESNRTEDEQGDAPARVVCLEVPHRYTE